MRRLPFSVATALAIAIAATAIPVRADDSDDSKPAIDLTAPSNLDQAVHNAQVERASGKLSDATRSLSQLMLVAPDDARVVGEYGKLLVQEGQAHDGVQFLHRAIELAADDWTLYSALGVAYDEIGDARSAGFAYQHALALKPGEPVILNNIALSRFAIGDLKGAHEMLIAAQAAGGTDAEIAQNLSMVEAKMPAAKAAAAIPVAAKPVSAPKSAPVAASTAAVVAPKPATVEVAALPDAKQPVAANGAPRNIVMQAVPKDPLAGPTAAKKWAKHKVAVVHPTATVTAASATPAKPVTATTVATTPAKPVTAVKPATAAQAAKPASVAAEHKSNKTPSLRMSADAS